MKACQAAFSGRANFPDFPDRVARLLLMMVMGIGSSAPIKANTMSAVDFTRFVHDLASRSGEAILPFFRTAMATHNKAGSGSFDPVTEGDRGAEMVMRRIIKESFPDHGIVGEEFGSEREDAEFVWVLDPIDGTRAFVSGLPVWGTLIGLMRGGVPAYGMMHQPFTRERYFGDGQSAHYQGPEGTRSIMTRACAELSAATVMTTSPKLFKDADQKAYERVESACRLARYGCDCYAYCMLAAGHVDLVIEAGLQPFDIVALIPVIEGAGGIITSWDGSSAAKGGRVIAAGDRRIHEAALTLLNG
jgi:histidinol phosphatase-like enzyme (inositol monophosphatase family)